jgi:hypothetical protein
MAAELKNKQNEEDRTKAVVENLKQYGQQMREVKTAAMALSNEYSEAFTVFAFTNENLSRLKASTQFEFEGEQMSLHLSITRWKSGIFEDSINIRQDCKTWMDDGVSYRLEVTQGSEVAEEYKKLLEFEKSNPEIMEGMIDLMFDQSARGGLSRYADRFAESTISAEDALKVLQNAVNLHRPTKSGYPSGVSLEDFCDYLKQQKSNSQNNPELSNSH